MEPTRRGSHDRTRAAGVGQGSFRPRSRYYLNVEDADVDAFDPMLDTIDLDWRSHVTNLRGD
jgi:hypothetical protein